MVGLRRSGEIEAAMHPGRFLLFPDKDVYTRLDFAFTREDPTFYLFIGEAF